MPGRLIGHLRLGYSDSKEIASLGKPSSGDAAMGHSISIWRANTGNEVDIATAIIGDGSARVVRSVRVTSEYFKTRGGIGVGSTLAAVEKAFPMALPVRHSRLTAYVGGVALLDDQASGIAFEFPVTSGWLSDAASCDAVTIHPPHQSILTVNPPIYQVTSAGALYTTE